MPPKKPVTGTTSNKPQVASKSTVTTKSKTSSLQTKKPVVKSTTTPSKKAAPPKNVTKKTQAKSTGKDKVAETSKKKVKAVSKEDKAAIKLQSHFRRLLAKKIIQQKRVEKQNYEEIIEKLQKEAFLEIVKREREAAEKERIKEEEERRRKREEAKQKKVLLEAAFDGDLQTIENILNEAKKSDSANVKKSGPALKLHILRHQHALIECEDANNNSLLSEAAAGGDGDTISFLVNKGASLNSRGAFKRTPLYRAAFGGHIQAVQILLENGADPRIYADDGNTPEQIAAIPPIKDIIANWDIEETDRLLARIKKKEEERITTEREQAQLQTKLITEEISKAEKEYKMTQKQLKKCFEELSKRIFEHDKCVLSNQVKTEITLQAVHDAEEDLEKAKRAEEISREKLSDLKLKLRDEAMENKDTVDAVAEKGVKCHIKELDDVLLRDVGDRIKSCGKWPLIVDTSGQVSVFLRYRDTNYLNAFNAKEMQPEVIRKALLGSIRYGKFLVIDMMDVDMLEVVTNRMNEIQKDLFSSLLSKDILGKERYLSLVRESDGEEYKKENFNSLRIENFKFVLLTKLWNPPEKWLDTFYPIRVVIS